ncbi:hypothetical protein niasHT_003930 [Heterodera trifolii]|uniref:Tyrosine-protein kinase n=1 Tax=Heterodera trifolii TaxID=157864 RepID=A0ABD2LV73_9BILA
MRFQCFSLPFHSSYFNLSSNIRRRPLDYTRTHWPQDTMNPDERQMWRLPYHHGLLPREDVTELLPNDGDFLVRTTEEISGTERVFALSVNVGGLVNHVIFRRHKGMYTVDLNSDKGFRTIERFVDHYLRTGTSVTSERFVTLRKAVPRANWELSHSAVTIRDELGRGAFGVVRRGELNERSGNRIAVAVKEVSQTSTKEQIKEFMNEARIMRQLDHPNVIRFHGVAVGQEPLMIVIELASDGSLTDYLKTQRRSARTRLFMCVGAAAGLTHIHSKGIIHCDIAARNCLYSNGVVKISDFGMAHRGPVKKMEPNARVPVKWLSPEALAERCFTAKSDTWAYGVLCWEIFSNGEIPYGQTAGSDVAVSLVNGQRLEFPRDAPSKLVEFILQHIWDAETSGRYSMAAVDDWLKRHT